MLIASDLDGTLLNNNSDISENNKNMIEKLIKDDHKFVIATGRIYPSALKYARELSLDTPVIACNGAVIMDHVNNQIIKDYPIKKEIMKELLSICEKHNIYFHLYSLDTVYGKENKKLIKKYLNWIKNDARFSEIKVEITDDIKSVIENETIYKLGLYLDDELSKEAYNEMIKVKGIQSCFSLSTLVDIFNEEASKGVALEYVST